MNAYIIMIFKDVGGSDEYIRTLSAKYDILQEPELGGGGVVKSEAVTLDEYSEGDMAIAGRYIAQIMGDAEKEEHDTISLC